MGKSVFVFIVSFVFSFNLIAQDKKEAQGSWSGYYNSGSANGPISLSYTFDYKLSYYGGALFVGYKAVMGKPSYFRYKNVAYSSQDIPEIGEIRITGAIGNLHVGNLFYKEDRIITVYIGGFGDQNGLLGANNIELIAKPNPNADYTSNVIANFIPSELRYTNADKVIAIIETKLQNQKSKKTAEALLSGVSQKIKANDFVGAEADIDEAVSLDPENPYIDLLKGELTYAKRSEQDRLEEEQRKEKIDLEERERAESKKAKESTVDNSDYYATIFNMASALEQTGDNLYGYGNVSEALEKYKEAQRYYSTPRVAEKIKTIEDKIMAQSISELGEDMGELLDPKGRTGFSYLQLNYSGLMSKYGSGKKNSEASSIVVGTSINKNYMTLDIGLGYNISPDYEYDIQMKDSKGDYVLTGEKVQLRDESLSISLAGGLNFPIISEILLVYAQFGVDFLSMSLNTTMLSDDFEVSSGSSYDSGKPIFPFMSTRWTTGLNLTIPGTKVGLGVTYNWHTVNNNRTDTEGNREAHKVKSSSVKYYYAPTKEKISYENLGVKFYILL